jgi:hypothetical protein
MQPAHCRTGRRPPLGIAAALLLGVGMIWNASSATFTAESTTATAFAGRLYSCQTMGRADEVPSPAV